MCYCAHVASSRWDLGIISFRFCPLLLNEQALLINIDDTSADGRPLGWKRWQEPDRTLGWTEERASEPKDSRAWGEIISRRVSSTVKPVCFDQGRLIQLMTPKPNNLDSYCVTPCKPRPVNMYWMRRLSWGSYKILSSSFSVLLPDFDVTQQMVVGAVHMGGSIRAVTRRLHQRKLAKLCMLLFSKTDCATGAQLWENGFHAKLSTSSDSSSTTHFSE